jgi:hypothetical protein
MPLEWHCFCVCISQKLMEDYFVVFIVSEILMSIELQHSREFTSSKLMLLDKFKLNLALILWLSNRTIRLCTFQFKWDAHSLVSTTEELLGRKCSGSGLENREHGRRDPSRWQRCTLSPQKLALTSPTSSYRSVGIVRSRTQATEFSFLVFTYQCDSHLML